jgi:hypothetical protein
VSTTAVLVVVFVLTALLPEGSYLALLLLVLSPAVTRVASPLLRRLEELRAGRQTLRPTPPT